MIGSGHIAVIVNPAATKVGADVRARVVAALELHAPGRVREIQTPGPGTAGSLAAEAAADGAALVVAVGGDGHASDILGALVATDVPVALIPGGNANVIARALGWPARQGVAVETLALLLPHAPTRDVRLGVLRFDDGATRIFGLNAGVGLDADAVARVERRPAMKHRLRHAAFALAGIAAAGALSRRPPRLSVAAGDREVDAVSVLLSCARPYTYLAGRELDILPAADFDGRIAWLALTTRRLRHLAWIGLSILARGRVPQRHTSAGCDDEVRVTAREPVAVQADGEALGLHKAVVVTTSGPVRVLDPGSLKSDPGGPI